MKIGTLLVDNCSGLKLLVVEASPEEDAGGRVSVDGRELTVAAAVPAGDVQQRMTFTCDPGGRG